MIVDSIPYSPSKRTDQMSVTASSMQVVALNAEEDTSDPVGSTLDEVGVSGWADIPALEDVEAEDLPDGRDGSEHTAPATAGEGGSHVAQDGVQDGPEAEAGSNSRIVDDGELHHAGVSRQRDQGQFVLVDHTPEGEISSYQRARGDASLAVLAPSVDGTCPSINDEEDTVNDIDPHGERVSYGPVVDAIPTLSMHRTRAPSTAPSVTFSLAVEAWSVEEDIKQDEEFDETIAGDTTTGGESGWEDDTHPLDDLDTDHSLRRHSEPSSSRLQPLAGQTQIPEQKVIVDHTPQISTARPRVADASLATLAPSQGSTYRSEGNENDNDTFTNEEEMFGKVVDRTPRLAPIPFKQSESMAVGASSVDYRSEMERDDEMDFGGSLDGMDGWQEDESALEDIVVTEQTPRVEQQSDDYLVDHTPSVVASNKPKDPSVAVMLPSDDASSVVEDDSDSENEKHAFGPVVDVLPEQPSGNSTVTGSMAVEAHSLAEDIRRDEEMEGTMFGDSTCGGWNEDDAILEDLDTADQKEAELELEPEPNEVVSENASSHMEGSTIGKASQDGIALVDHTPSEMDSTVKNSVGWLLNVESGISGDDTDDMGTGTGWTQDDPEIEGGHQPEQAPEEDQVVDHGR